MINIFKTRHLKCLLFSIIITASISLISCSDTISNVDDIVFPDTNVSYLNQVQPFIKLTCAYATCHNSFDLAFSMSLDNYFDLTAAMSSAMIRPGNPDGSILIQMLEGKKIHYEYRYFRINDNQKKGLRTWINEGAKNN